MTEEASRRRATDTPTGIVTFLFTDVQDSAKLWDKYPSQMRAALKRHDEIFRSNIEAHGGYVFALGGDAFSVAFSTPIEALETSLAIQRALFTEEWPENVEVRVRMGLHSGRAEERDGNFFGPQVNRAARLMSAGHGGQVLLSSVTYGLVRDELAHLEPEAELRYLGEHYLKSLGHTERIFQLLVPDLPEEFPPIKTEGLVEEFVDLDRRYRRLGYLGGGGFGDVYLVHHETLDRDMALKVMRGQHAKGEDEKIVKLFKGEAKKVAKLSHPNVVAVHDAGEGTFERREVSYIVMEYVSGGTLRDLIEQKGGRLSPQVLVEHTMQVARALEVAHRHGIIHRDIKPENVLLTESGEAKVADFGIARDATSSTYTTRGGVLGTLPYLPPEQLVGDPPGPPGPRSDLYALGVVLYEMLTGKLPYYAETLIGIARKIVGEPLRPPKEVNPEVPKGLEVVCVRLLAKDPNERYQDAGALIADLERVRDDPDAVVGDTGPTIPDLGTVEDDTRPTTVRVPDLAGQKLAQTRSMLAEARLSLGSQNQAPSETVPEGEIIEQDPPAGTEMEPDSSVSVTVSSGLSSVEVPDLAGLNRSEAGSALASAGLKLGTQNEAPSETAPEDEIIGQYPAAQTKAERGSSVSITISSRPRELTVPDLIGQRLPQARGKLGQASLKLGGKSEVPSETVTKGRIIRQTPEAGTKVQPDSSVSVTVSSGSSTAEVPNLTGKTLPQAREALGSASLKLGGKNETPSDTVTKGRIIEQEPVAGTEVKRGSFVRVAVSLGPQEKPPPQTAPPEPVTPSPEVREDDERRRRSRIPILLLLLALLLALLGGVAYAFTPPKVPDLVGVASVEEAEEIAGDKFDVYRGDRVESEEPVGTILGQDPEAGTRAPRGSEIFATISLGVGVPDLEGKTVSEAAQVTGKDILVAGLGPKEGNPKSIVVSQIEGGETQLSEISEVQVKVSGGEEGVVPDVVGLDALQAAVTLIEAGFEPSSLDGDNLRGVRFDRSGEPEALLTAGGEDVSTKTVASAEAPEANETPNTNEARSKSCEQQEGSRPRNMAQDLLCEQQERSRASDPVADEMREEMRSRYPSRINLTTQ